ncbi:MAG TPA: TraB/GumN family protein, partial [Rudaea sp.]|nr:TraB/GumN family protein [Rudaea sp.]
MRPSFFLAAFLSLAAAAAVAQDGTPVAPATPPPPETPANTATLETVLVTGEQPGPGLWKVSRGEHVLWILGAQYPLPKNMTWRGRDVEQTISQSQAVIADATPKLELNFFHKLTLMPAVYGARKNEDGQTLQQILPPDVYTRWLALKAKYIGNDSGVERLRPMVAANELYDKALAKTGLARSGLIWDTVRGVAKKNRVRIVEPQAQIPMDDPRQTIRDFKATTGNLDIDCLAATMTRLETDLTAMRDRANAWAVGDIDALRKLPSPSQQEACRAAVSSNPRLRAQLEQGMARMDQAWLA